MLNKKESTKLNLYKEGLKYLTHNLSISENVLKKYLIPEKKRTKPESLNGIFKAILESAQNSSMSPYVIGKSISGIKSNIDPLGKILFDFNPVETYKKFNNLSDIELYNKIKPTLLSYSEKNKLWLRYCKTIISSSYFLSKYNNHNDFYKFIDLSYQNEQMKYFLPMLISFEIYGFGFALACDFLKEMGYTDYSKPDTHIKDILIACNLLTKKKDLKSDYQTLKIIESIANENSVTPYAVDKVLWLICSGEFYLDKNINNIGKNKKEFINFINK